MKRKYIMAAVVLVTCGSLFGCGKTSENTENTEGQSETTEKYIVEDQEYVYSPYGDIGQLGEEGYYYNVDYPGDEAYEVQGTAQYDFAAFYVDDEQGIVIEDSYGVEFAVDEEEHADWEECVHREDVVPSLQERMAPYLADSLLLLSLNIENGAFYSGNGQMLEGDYFFQQIWDRE